MINLQKNKKSYYCTYENYSRRKIAKQLGLDRATVGKYIDEYEEKEKLLQEDMEVDTGINTIYC